tara:strand:+ start:6162 stop:6341 length:180 start_codon:yes stop_codon:yes gene_type:complete
MEGRKMKDTAPMTADEILTTECSSGCGLSEYDEKVVLIDGLPYCVDCAEYETETMRGAE